MIEFDFDFARRLGSISRSVIAAATYSFVAVATILALPVAHCDCQTTRFKYEPAPVDNPLKGLVPYVGDHRKSFPHSLEFNYVPLNKLMVGPDRFDWGPLERLLDDVGSRGHQAVIRVWIEYPAKNGIPKFLINDGVKVTEWLNTNTDPFPREKCWTPDYQDPRVRKALTQFILALGKKYDGDARLGYITAGLLGTWGEWHTYPRTELFASKEVQMEVMEAYTRAFKSTPVLLRYPAGVEHDQYAANHQRPFGYHDDSFAWATLDTGNPDEYWFFVPSLKQANALEKWKKHPIGGEIRPEVWGKIFDAKPKVRKAQDFGQCVRQTHVTWLMDSGMFQEKQPQARIDRAKKQVQKMGYEFHIVSASIKRNAAKTLIEIKVKNTGVAPFYHDWRIELGTLAKGSPTKTYATDWKLARILPGEVATWSTELEINNSKALAVRVINPLSNGLPLRFANDKQRQKSNGWLVLN